VVTFDHSYKKARLGTGQSLLALGKFEKAAKVFWGKPISDEDLNEDFELGKIISGIYTDRYDNVEVAIHDGMMIDPDDARLWNAKGRWHDGRAEWMDALSCYVSAMNTGKWRSSTINNMGMSLLLQGRFAEAKDKFKQSIDLNPDSIVYDNNLRMAHILTDNFGAALKDIGDSRAADLLNDAGFVSANRGKKKLAEKLFRKALDISPVFHPDAQANLDNLTRLP